MRCRNIIVAGTDTEIGKTVLSLLIMKKLIADGKNPVYIKPFQTGCKDVYDDDSDVRFIYENLGIKKDFTKNVINCNTNPKAPLFAAKDDNNKIDIKATCKKIEDLSKNYSDTVIELSGGLFVPVTENFLTIDMITPKDTLVLAARAGLGTINHTLLSIEALKQRDIKPEFVVFIDKDGCTDPVMIKENMEAVKMFSGADVYTLGKLENFESTEPYFEL